MAEVLSESGSNRFAVRAVCLAVSGVNHPTDEERILSWLRFALQEPIFQFSLALLKHIQFFDVLNLYPVVPL